MTPQIGEGFVRYLFANANHETSQLLSQSSFEEQSENDLQQRPQKQMTLETTTRADYGLEDIEIQEPSAPEQPTTTAKKHADHTHVQVDLDNLNGFWESQAKRVARNPCKYLLVSMFCAIALSAVGIIVGEFAVSANTGGWQSRGTMIADRQTQLMVVREHQEDLFTGDNDYWQELIDNVQPGWEDDDDDDGGRRLTTSTPKQYEFATKAQDFVDYLQIHIAWE